MAKNKQAQLAPQAAPMMRNSVVFRATTHGAVMQKWPRPRGAAKTAFRYYTELQFALAAVRASCVDALDRATADNFCNGCLYVWRDVLVRAQYGNLLTIIDPDGNELVRYSDVVPNAQLMLDQISTQTGSMLYRSDVGWVQLAPGLDGQAIVMVGGLPTYADIDPLIFQNAAFLLGSAEPLFPNARVVGNSVSVVANYGIGGALTLERAALSGDVTALQNDNALTIAAKAVSYAKIQDISAPQLVLGRNSAGAGSAEEVNLSELLDWIGGATRGDLLFRGATAWQKLPAGTAGQFLQTNGTSADPSYTSPATGSAGGGPTPSPYFADANIYLCPSTLTGAGLTTTAVASGTIYFYPIIVPWLRSFTSIALNIPAGGSVAGSSARLGLFNVAQATGGPGSVLLDAGTVTTATTGLRAITFAQDIPAGLYWIAVKYSAALTVRACAVGFSQQTAGWSLGAATPSPQGYVTRLDTFANAFADETAQTHALGNSAVPTQLIGIR